MFTCFDIVVVVVVVVFSVFHIFNMAGKLTTVMTFVGYLENVHIISMYFKRRKPEALAIFSKW